MRYRIRTLLLILTGVAVLVALGPRLWWRYKVSQALNATIEVGPELQWEFDPVNSARVDDYFFLASEQQRVLPQLLTVLKSKEPIYRRANAVRTMRLLAGRQPIAIRKQSVSALIKLLCDDHTPLDLSVAVLEAISALVPSTGLTEAERQQIRTRAAGASGNETAWINVLSELGGEEETVLLLRMFDKLDPSHKQIVCNSRIRRLTWEGLLPHVELWMRDPGIADNVLGEFGFDILSHTSSGRNASLRFINDSSQPSVLRVKAVEQLQSTVAGIDELEIACKDESIAIQLSGLLNADCKTHLAAKRISLLAVNGNDFWDELIDLLDPKSSPAAGGRALPKEAESQLQKLAQHRAKLALDLLRLLSANAEPTTQAEWRSWRDAAQPGVIAQRDLLAAAIDRPDLLGCPALLRRIGPYGWRGDIPKDCLPLYEQMLQSDNPALQYWSCRALLLYATSDEAIDVAIDLVERSKPNDNAQVRSGEIEMLQDRFAVNFFWDTKAWRKWALNRRSKSEGASEE